MLIKKKALDKISKAALEEATTGVKTVQKSVKSELKKQLTDLDDFVKHTPEMKARQDELVKSLEKLAQSTKPLVK